MRLRQQAQSLAGYSVIFLLLALRNSHLLKIHLHQASPYSNTDERLKPIYSRRLIDDLLGFQLQTKWHKSLL